MQSVFNSFVEHYQNSTESEVAELSKQTMNKIQALNIKPSPIHYTLIFEYLAKIDPSFAEQIEMAIVKGQYNDVTAELLFFDLISTIFKKHLPTDTFTNVLTGLLTSLNDWQLHIHQEKNILKYQQQEIINEQPENKILLADTIFPTLERMILKNEELKKSIQASQQQVEELTEKLNNASQQAKTDELTKLLNRRGFNLAFEHLAIDAKENRQSFCLLVLDLDLFKIINDTHGHLFGDAVLRYIAKLLQNEMKGKDTIARVGGEEFALILPETPYSGALKFANSLRERIANQTLEHKTKNERIKLTVSIGLSVYQLGEPLETLFDRADKALYLAKNNGRNRVCTEIEL